MDSFGNLFFGVHEPIAVACWDSSKPYHLNNMRIVAHNAQTLQFSSGLKVIRNRKGDEEVWILTNRLQKFMAGTINYNEPNFRIQARKTQEMLNGNKCLGSGINMGLTGLTFPLF